MLDHLRTTSPRTLARFAFTGGVVALVHMTIMTSLVGLLDAPAQPSLLIAYCGAVAVHFSMNRNLVFTSDAGFALHLSAQGTRYLGLVLFSYGTSALSLAVLPGILDLPVLVVYFGTIACLSVVSFTVLQGLIFHPPAAADGGDSEAARDNGRRRDHDRLDGTSSRSSLSSKP
jgi:putative flippase GtrA